MTEEQIEMAAIALIRYALSQVSIENHNWTVTPSDAEWCKGEGMPSTEEIAAEFSKVADAIWDHSRSVMEVELESDAEANINFFTNYIPRRWHKNPGDILIDHDYFADLTPEEQEEDRKMWDYDW